MSFATTDLCDDNANLLEDGRLAALHAIRQSARAGW